MLFWTEEVWEVGVGRCSRKMNDGSVLFRIGKIGAVSVVNCEVAKIVNAGANPVE